MAPRLLSHPPEYLKIINPNSLLFSLFLSFFLSFSLSLFLSFFHSFFLFFFLSSFNSILLSVLTPFLPSFFSFCLLFFLCCFSFLPFSDNFLFYFSFVPFFSNLLITHPPHASFSRAHFTGKKLEVKQLESNPTASTYSMHEKSKDRNFDRAIAREMYGSGGRGVKPMPRRQSEEKEVEKEVPRWNR